MDPSKMQEGVDAPGASARNGATARRNACAVCRKQKLRCDGTEPACSRCARIGHRCVYDETRRRSGPRQGYVKGLETRLAQVETLLKAHEAKDLEQSSHSALNTDSMDHNFLPTDPALMLDAGNQKIMLSDFPRATLPNEAPETNKRTTIDQPEDQEWMWQLLELGLDEPLPLQEVISELTDIYFDRIHPSLPMLHRARHLAAMDLSPQQRPPIALRYAMWTLAASVSRKYLNLQEHFYLRARKYTEQAELTGHGEKVVSVAHTQTWILIGVYEFKMMHFPRTWLSIGRAARLAQMMGMHRVDCGPNVEMKQTLNPPRDWIETEERRRTFWMAFCIDRYGTVGTGWPMIIDEQDITTNLPCTEEDFEQGIVTQSISLDQAMTDPSSTSNLSSLAGVIVTATLFGRLLVHLHRPSADDAEDDPNGEYWTRHRHLDNTLLNTSLHLPTHLRLPAVSPSPNTIFLNMNVHAAAICLHTVAVMKGERHEVPSHIVAESKMRCFTAAAEIGSIMRMIAHADFTAMNTFLPFCVFVATRVFIQHTRSRPFDNQARSATEFMLSVMVAMQSLNPLSASLLSQLQFELEGTGIEAPLQNATLAEIQTTLDRYTQGGLTHAPRLAKSNTDNIDGFSWTKSESQSPMPRFFEQSTSEEASNNGQDQRPRNTPLPTPPEIMEFGINRSTLPLRHGSAPAASPRAANILHLQRSSSDASAKATPSVPTSMLGMINENKVNLNLANNDFDPSANSILSENTGDYFGVQLEEPLGDFDILQDGTVPQDTWDFEAMDNDVYESVMAADIESVGSNGWNNGMGRK